jgi:hypothetical protein
LFLKQWYLSLLQLFFTTWTPAVSFSVGVFEGITEMHDTARVRAVRQPERMAELVNRFFHRAKTKPCLVHANAEAVQ